MCSQEQADAFFSLAWKNLCFFSKMSGKCPAVVSDDDSHDHACTHLYLLAPGKVMKTWSLVGNGFFQFIQSFRTNEKFFFKQTTNKTSKYHMKDLLLFISLQENFYCLFFTSYKTTQKLQIAF